MSYLNADGSCIYDHLSDLNINISIDEIANLIEGSPRGTIRLMAAIMRIRKKKWNAKIQKYRDNNDEDIVAYCEKRGDPISAAFEKLLNDEEY